MCYGNHTGGKIMIWKRSDVSRRSAWTKADIRRARQAPLKPVLEHLGYRLQPLQNGNYLITGLAPEIVVKDHYWVCTDTGAAACPELCRGGNAIDFLMRVRKTSFNDALRLLLADATLPEAS
jgi:hypothetical protein